MIGRHPHRAFLLLVGALSFQLLLSDRQPLTGDEPRYLIYAVSFIRHGRYVMPAAEWSRLSMRATGHPSAALPTGAGGAFLMNGVYVPTLLSPTAVLFWLYRLLRRVGGAAAAFAIPFAHPCGAGVAALLFAGLLAILIRQPLWARASAACGLAFLAGIAFMALNLSIYGAVTGPVNTARRRPPTQWFPVLSMQLFDVRHGLFAYAPV